MKENHGFGRFIKSIKMSNKKGKSEPLYSNKPAYAGVLLRTNSPVNCKEAVHTARITEGVEEHG